MIRGIYRHEGFQKSFGKWIKTLGDIRTTIKVSGPLMKTLESIIPQECLDSKRVYSFKEVVLNRLANQSRRADLVLYVPGVRIIVIEYKTTESDSNPINTSAHRSQLKDTYDNLVNCVNFRISMLDSFMEFKDSNIPITSLLLTRRFLGRRIKTEDVVLSYEPPNPVTKAFKEPVDERVMLNILNNMGQMLN